MADTPESKPPFWSSLPGILTGLGGVIAAVTGLIIALNATGVIGSKSNSNAVPPVNTAVTLASAPSPSPSLNLDKLTGKWKVIEEPSQDPHFDQVKTVTWDYDAAVKGNVLTLTGKILYVNDVNDKPDDKEKRITATYETTLTGLSGEGKYRLMKMDGEPVMNNKARIRLEDDLEKFEIKMEVDGKTYRLEGRKL